MIGIRLAILIKEAAQKHSSLPFVYAGYSGGAQTAYIIVTATEDQGMRIRKMRMKAEGRNRIFRVSFGGIEESKALPRFRLFLPGCRVTALVR